MLQLCAIDAGGTSTRAMVLSGDGDCLGVGRGGRGNPVSDGVDAAAAAIGAAVGGALTAAAVAGADVAAVTLAMAGGSVRATPDWLDPTLRGLGVTAAPVVEHDLLAMFCSGTPAPAGYGLVGGTGATAVRVRDGEVELAADGVGWLLGDRGSGFWIGRRVARAVAAELDGAGPPTSLTPRVLAQLGIPADEGDAPPAGARADGRPATLSALVAAVYTVSPLRLAALAPLALADETDAVSVAIVDEAGAALGRTVLQVAEPGLPGPLVVGGGVAAQARVREPALRVARDGGVTGPVVVVQDGLVGAGVIALRRAGVDVGPETFARLGATTAAQVARSA